MHYFFNKGTDSILTESGWVLFADLEKKTCKVLAVNSINKPSLQKASIIINATLKKYGESIGKCIMTLTAEELNEPPRPFFAMSNKDRNTLKSGQDQLVRYILCQDVVLTSSANIFNEVDIAQLESLEHIQAEREKLQTACIEHKEILSQHKEILTQLEAEKRKLCLQAFLVERENRINIARLANGEDLTQPPVNASYLTFGDENRLRKEVLERTEQEIIQLEQDIKLGKFSNNEIKDCIIMKEEQKPPQTAEAPLKEIAEKSTLKPPAPPAPTSEPTAQPTETAPADSAPTDEQVEALDPAEELARQKLEAEALEEQERIRKEEVRQRRIERDLAKLNKKIDEKADNERKILERALVHLIDLEQAKIQRFKLEGARISLSKEGLNIADIQAVQDKIDRSKLKLETLQNSIERLAKAESEAEPIAQKTPPGEIKLTCDLTYKDNEFVQEINQATEALEVVFKHASQIASNYDNLLSNIDLLAQDELHYIEFNKLDLTQSLKFTQNFHDLRIERRLIKDEMYIADLLLNKPKQNILEYFTQVLKKIEELEQRNYTVRIPEKYHH